MLLWEGTKRPPGHGEGAFGMHRTRVENFPVRPGVKSQGNAHARNVPVLPWTDKSWRCPSSLHARRAAQEVEAQRSHWAMMQTRSEAKRPRRLGAVRTVPDLEERFSALTSTPSLDFARCGRLAVQIHGGFSLVKSQSVRKRG
ncbi:hypothetical protein OPT61_g6910 [Boeremia exigua]|uniref:Uncharacterized protein n=1 Tax=Boeremia exigua TaxID=749465 RepID=A0ACC2I5V7_9PLEO|nr:hypothetical protein OPT61_g6910 [Boeremia exigua]